MRHFLTTGSGAGPMSDLSVSPLWVDARDRQLTRAHIEAFWRDHGMTDAVAVYEGPELPADPNTCLVVTWTTGPGFQLEQALDTPAFQVRVMGPQGNPDQARILAENVDRSFTRHVWPAMLGELYVVEIRRAGGTPAVDRLDNADRTHYVCTYLADIEAD
jgi:hypothetical protein